MSLKGGWRKFWDLLWKDESIKGWLFSIIFLFVFIKFIFFPVLGFVTGTSLPLAIVESCSMYHQGDLFSDYDSWWERHDSKYSEFNIGPLDFSTFFLNNGLNKGDILFVIKANPEKLEIGNIIIFDAGTGTPIIHRIIEIKEENGEKIFSTIGDNNDGQLAFEKEILSNHFVGKAVLKITPYFGWVKLIFYEHQKPREEKGFCNEK